MREADPPKRRGAPWKSKRLLPLFPTYLFVEFDADDTAWRVIASPWAADFGVVKLFSSAPESPTPLPTDEVVNLMARVWVTETPVKRLEALAAGNLVQFVDGPLDGVRGVCAWSDEERVGVLLQMLGSKNIIPVARSAVELVRRDEGSRLQS